MSEAILWISAEADKRVEPPNSEFTKRRRGGAPVDELSAHSFPSRPRSSEGLREESHGTKGEGRTAACAPSETYSVHEACAEGGYETAEEERRRQMYRRRTVKMLGRYMRYSIETGRLPSLLGRELFAAKVTPYTAVTFEDRVIFVHDMEKCLDRLDKFSRDIIARHILQEHDQAETARLLHCAQRTIRTYVPMVLDLLSEILLEYGVLTPIE